MPLNQRELSIWCLENAFCHVHKLLFAWLTDNIHHIVFYRIIQFTCNAVNTHLNHIRIFLFSTPCGVGSLLCMRNINCKPHWLAICWNSVVIKDRKRDVQVLKNGKVYFKWGWNKTPFDINSVVHVFHFDDFNYGRWSQPYCKGLGAIRAKIDPTSDVDKTTTLLINCCYHNLL
jgi:hypothetical protein